MSKLAIEQNENPFENLASAVVKRAVKDYKRVLNKLAKDPNDEEMRTEKEALEDFFRSQWCYLLTNVDGEMLIGRLMEV